MIAQFFPHANSQRTLFCPKYVHSRTFLRIFSPLRRKLPLGESQKSKRRRDLFMKDCTNGGCACTPNQSIQCTVNNCANHCQDQNYCGFVYG